MLTKIILSNFKSFKNETVIEFSKTNYKFLEGNVSKNGILKGLMFVGANASGKSNALSAIKFLLDELFLDVKISIGFLKCLFSDSSDISISYFFSIDDKVINYLLEFNTLKKMISEKVTVDGRVLLERIGSNAKSYITEKENFDNIDKEILFLRTIYFNTGFSDNTTLYNWFEYLKNSIYFNAFDKSILSYNKNDFAILEYLKQNGTSEINNFFDKYNFEQTIDYSNTASCKNYIIKTPKDEKIIFFKRKGVYTPIPFEYESLGNRTLLTMLPSILYISKNSGMLLMDEFSSGFHNELERLIVKFFMEFSNNSQMIFVSHSTNLLSISILRPDQVYSVEFKGQDGSVLKRFSEEQPRLSQNMEKMYLSGVFGGLPNYKNDYED